VIAGFALLGLAFFFGALNAFRQESVAAEGYGLQRPTHPKTVLVVCPDSDRSAAGEVRSAASWSSFGTGQLMRVVSRSKVDAIYVTGTVGGEQTLQSLAEGWKAPIHAPTANDPRAVARMILTSEHRVIVAVCDEETLVPTLVELGIEESRQIEDACGDLLVVTIQDDGGAALLRLEY
jgi:hypothetical protein